MKRSFIDRLRIFVKSGSGGTGIPKLGGIGGDGMLTIINWLKNWPNNTSK